MKESELAESNTIFENQQIDITFNDSQSKKEVKYKLLNEEKESLLIREDLISNPDNFQIKISELFQNEANGQYYLNKDKSKEKYLKNLLSYDKKSEDIKLNNKDQNEMKALYRETSLKHPRKLVDGEVQKYRFCSWMGCFTCQRVSTLEKNEFKQLGLGITSYFKTIKLFIFFFAIISCINLYPVLHYLKYNSVINNSNFFFKTTLGNTKVTTYNSVKYHFAYKDYPPLKLNCQNKTIGKFIYGLEPNSEVKELFNVTEIKYEGTGKGLPRKQIQYYNEKMVKECNLTKECQLTIDSKISDFYNFVEKFLSHDNYLFYECIDMDLIPENTSQGSLRNITTLSGIGTLIILILLYYYYRKAITIDAEFYHKDKVIINNYTLVLRGLKKKASSFFQELNDLVSHLNNIISSELKTNPNNFDQDINFFKNDEINNYNEFVRNKEMYIFDISISNVNEEKKSIIEKIKSLKDEITDIKEGHDTIEKKIKHKITTAVESVTSLYNQIKNKNKTIDDDEEENNEPLMEKTNDNINQENQEKIEKTKKKINKQMKKISKNEIKGMHIDSFSRKYVDIYITFRNPLISNYIYQNYNKTIFQRILLFFCCKIKTIKLFYYKRQWLHFYLSNNAPTNIIWENCYISGKTKLCRRFFVFFITIITIIISTALIYAFTDIKENKTKAIIYSYVITGILKVISIVSSTLLEKLTKCEKNSNLTKNITSDIEKYFLLNYAVSTISVNLRNNYTYQNFESQYPIIMCSILQSMMLSIITEHLSTLAKYLFNFFKRYLDSDFENGKKTKLKKKNEYEELYIGPEFPIGSRLSSIFVNLGLCLLYGTSCPLIFLFFTLYLLTTFIVDKILIIHYYRKPPYYDNYFTVLTKKILFLSIIVYIYGTVYYISNPYLFNYYQNTSINFGYNGLDAYIFLNPFTIFFRIWGSYSSDKISIDKFNLAEISYVFIYLMCAFIFPLLFINIYHLFKKKADKKLSLQNSPNIDIGLIYSIDELNKYYEVKKLELFKFLLNFDKKNSKEFQKYSKLADNYKNILDYIKQNIDYKNSKDIINKQQSNENKIEDNNIISTNANIACRTKDSNGIFIKDKDDLRNDRLLLGDPSFNLAFIPNYEMFAYFDLLYCV